MTDPLTLLRSGMDTMAIAKFLKTTEADVYNEIHRLKELPAKRKRDRAYSAKKFRKARRAKLRALSGGLIPYAGSEHA